MVPVREVTPALVSVRFPPNVIVPPPASPIPVVIVAVELARLALVIPAVPERFAFVNPLIVFEPAVSVLLVRLSVLDEVMNPALFAH